MYLPRQEIVGTPQSRVARPPIFSFAPFHPAPLAPFRSLPFAFFPCAKKKPSYRGIRIIPHIFSLVKSFFEFFKVNFFKVKVVSRSRLFEKRRPKSFRAYDICGQRDVCKYFVLLLSLSLSAGSVSLPLRGRWQTERRASLDCLTDEESPQGICNALFPVGDFLRKVTYSIYQSHNRMFAKSCSPHPSRFARHLPRRGRLMRYTAPNMPHTVETPLPSVGADSIRPPFGRELSFLKNLSLGAGEQCSPLQGMGCLRTAGWFEKILYCRCCCPKSLPFIFP